MNSKPKRTKKKKSELNTYGILIPMLLVCESY